MAGGCVAPRHGFRFKNKLYSLDASLLDLSLKIFPWAHFAKGKAAVKLHVGLDHDGHLSAFATLTHGHTSDLAVARTLAWVKGSTVVCDRGYQDYAWFKALTDKSVFFVCRSRRNAVYRVVEHRGMVKRSDVTADQVVQYNGVKPTEIGLPRLRRVGYRDPETGQRYVFITNNFHLSAKTIAEIYRQRW